jgi:hypothetical protein
MRPAHRLAASGITARRRPRASPAPTSAAGLAHWPVLPDWTTCSTRGRGFPPRHGLRGTWAIRSSATAGVAPELSGRPTGRPGQSQGPRPSAGLPRRPAVLCDPGSQLISVTREVRPLKPQGPLPLARRSLITSLLYIPGHCQQWLLQSHREDLEKHSLALFPSHRRPVTLQVLGTLGATHPTGRKG